MIGLKNSYEIAYNGTENECRFELYCDSATDLQGLTHFDGIKIQMGSECTDIATGDKYLLNGSGVWVLQPSANAWVNVYTKSETDTMVNAIYQTMMYYHTVQESTDGSITFYTLGGSVGSLTIYGNGQQTGTPTPDNPVMPTFCGVRTENLSPPLTEWVDGYVSSNGNIAPPSDVYKEKSSDYISVKAGAAYTFSRGNGFPNDPWRAIGWYAQDKTFISRASGNYSDALSTNAPSNAIYCRLSYRTQGETTNPMLNLGSTALPYEPFGYKIPITCAGQTNNVYISAPLRKAIDGSDAVDVLSNDGTITREVDENGNALVTPTTETIDFPDIAVVDGENTLTVDTELPPSLIEITGGITHE